MENSTNDDINASSSERNDLGFLNFFQNNQPFNENVTIFEDDNDCLPKWLKINIDDTDSTEKENQDILVKAQKRKISENVNVSKIKETIIIDDYQQFQPLNHTENFSDTNAVANKITEKSQYFTQDQTNIIIEQNTEPKKQKIIISENQKPTKMPRTKVTARRSVKKFPGKMAATKKHTKNNVISEIPSEFQSKPIEEAVYKDYSNLNSQNNVTTSCTIGENSVTLKLFEEVLKNLLSFYPTYQRYILETTSVPCDLSKVQTLHQELQKRILYCFETSYSVICVLLGQMSDCIIISRIMNCYQKLTNYKVDISSLQTFLNRYLPKIIKMTLDKLKNSTKCQNTTLKNILSKPTKNNNSELTTEQTNNSPSSSIFNESTTYKEITYNSYMTDQRTKEYISLQRNDSTTNSPALQNANLAGMKSVFNNIPRSVSNEQHKLCYRQRAPGFQQYTSNYQQQAATSSSYQQQVPIHQAQVPMYQHQVPMHQHHAPIHQQQVPTHQQLVPIHQHQELILQQQAPIHHQRAHIHQQQAPIPQQQVLIHQQEASLHHQKEAIHQQHSLTHQQKMPNHQQQGQYNQQQLLNIRQQQQISNFQQQKSTQHQTLSFQEQITFFEAKMQDHLRKTNASNAPVTFSHIISPPPAYPNERYNTAIQKEKLPTQQNQHLKLNIYHETYNVQERSSLSRDSGIVSPRYDERLTGTTELENSGGNVSRVKHCTPVISYVTSMNPDVMYSTESKCRICNVTTNLKCLGCHTIYYCSTECQVIDWTNHQPDCISDKRNGNNSEIYIKTI